jgi:hypothetical protein
MVRCDFGLAPVEGQSMAAPCYTPGLGTQQVFNVHKGTCGTQLSAGPEQVPDRSFG